MFCYFKIFNPAGQCRSSLLLIFIEILVFISLFEILLGDLGLGCSSGIICRHITGSGLLLLWDFKTGVAIALLGSLEPIAGCSMRTILSSLNIIERLVEFSVLLKNQVSIPLLESACLLQHCNIVGQRPDSIFEVDEIEDHV